MSIRLSIFILLISTQVYSQTDRESRAEQRMRDRKERIMAEDHLEPSANYFELYDFQLDYYKQIDSILLGHVGTRPLARMLVLPSFEAEYVISIDVAKNEYTLTYLTADRSIWETHDKNDIRVIKKNVAVSCELAEEWRSLYELFILQTKYTSGPPAGLDGTDYYFTTYRKFGQKTGCKWSPEEGTKIQELVSLTESLKLFVEKGSIDKKVEEELIERMYALRGRI